MKITKNEGDWNSETLILDFLQDMQHMMLYYRLNPSEMGLSNESFTHVEGMLIDNFGELLECMGYNPKEVYNRIGQHG